MEDIKYNRNAILDEIGRINAGDNETSIEEARHIGDSVSDLDSMNAPDTAYIPLLARAQSL